MYRCLVRIGDTRERIEFVEYDETGTSCGARLERTGAQAIGATDEVIAAVTGRPVDDVWVGAVAAALIRERTWREGRRPDLHVTNRGGEMFHTSRRVNRESIRRHGLDWRRMAAAPGIAGSRQPELPGIFLCGTYDEIGFFTRMSEEPVDVWAVRVDGLWVETGPNGWMITPEQVPPDRLRLIALGRRDA